MAKQEIIGSWQKDAVTLALGADLGKLTLVAKENQQLTGLPLFIGGNQLVGVGETPPQAFQRVLYLTLPENLAVEYGQRYLANILAASDGVLPAPHQAVFAKYFKTLTPLLELLGIQLTAVTRTKPEKKRPAKAQHRFTKEVAAIPFYVDYDGAKAEVYWQKRNELLIKKGAQMKAEPHLNADGTTGFAVRFAEQIRQEQQDAFNADFVTTKDVVLKSVNEVGHFLYFANTNSWLQLKDKEGKTIDAWTVVK